MRLSAYLPACFALLTLLLPTFAAAQGRLVINGLPVAGLNTALVPGSAYAPAEPYARTLGAQYRYDARAGVLLVFGGRVLSLRTFPTPAEAAAATEALSVEGRRVASTGAVSVAGTVYLPVKSVSAALGGRTAYLAAAGAGVGTVVVIFPRPELVGVSPPRVWGSFERFVLTFNAPVAYQDLFEPTLGVARLRFARAELGSEGFAERRFSGERFSDAAFVPGDGFLDFNLALQDGNTYRPFVEPYGDGERVVIDVFRDGVGLRGAAPVLVLAADAGTLSLAQGLRTALEARGVRVELRRTALTGTPPLGFDAPFLLLLRAAPLAAGRFNVFYLPDAAEALPMLDAPVRQAALASPSEGALAQLARLEPDFGVGRRFAQGLAVGLEERTTLTLGALSEAPLLGLSGAAGRGVMLELPADSGADAELTPPLAVLVSTLLLSTPLNTPLQGR